MILGALILLPFAGGLAAVLLEGPGGGERRAALWANLAAAGLAVALILWGEEGRWLAHHRSEWSPALGVSLIFAADGLSAALCAVSTGLGAVGVLASKREIAKGSGLFHLCVCWTVAAANGVFLSFDLIVFVFFWEAMLLPSFLLIALYGHGRREAAGLKYLIYNAVGGLFLLAAVFALAAYAEGPGFDAFALAEQGVAPAIQPWLLIGFAIAFLTKLPAVALHAWLPDAHTQAPTAGSVLLAGVLLKTGAYGLYRFPPMLFPDALETLAPVGMALGVIGALYGGMLACGQFDAKRLVAYTSVAHMGLVLLGISAGTELALAGAGVEMIAHAFSSSALFVLVGALQARTGVRDMRQLGGLQDRAPRFAAAFALFFAAALAMPGTANFVGEALVIIGAFDRSWPFAVLAASSLVISVVYATRLFQGVVFGREKPEVALPDLAAVEFTPVVILAAATLAIGLSPDLLLDVIAPAVEAALAPRAP